MTGPSEQTESRGVALVDRLRAWARLVPTSEAGETAFSAADEIERLQRELADLNEGRRAVIPKNREHANALHLVATAYLADGRPAPEPAGDTALLDALEKHVESYAKRPEAYSVRVNFRINRTAQWTVREQLRELLGLPPPPSEGSAT